MPKTSDKFKFEISLSVLNHLGRNLYRNVITVLGEAISNSWDADAKNVWINIDKESGKFSIKDDGVGMNAGDFQSKFLKIGYSKRSDGKTHTRGGRPYIGAKGIGKLALLSCAKRVSIYTRKRNQPYVGGTIDNGDLDKAIKHDLTPQKYPLGLLDLELIRGLRRKHAHGTILIFDGTREHIRNSIDHIKKQLALSFRFSLIDKNFQIFINDEKISIRDLSTLTDETEFCWRINRYSDEFLSALRKSGAKFFQIRSKLRIKGFIASVTKPRYLKIAGTDDRATIDLFVNGRLREKNILRHIPTQRIIESYIYGQIHFDIMDSAGKDPFTSSREGVIEDDENFKSLLDYLKRDALPKIFDTWDEQRLLVGSDGDEENTRKTKKQRKARGLFNESRQDFEQDGSSEEKGVVDEWLEELQNDAEFNIASYSDCFVSENLVRRYILEKNIALSKEAKGRSKDYKNREAEKKGKANISFDIRKMENELSYLDMGDLAFTVEGKKSSEGKQSIFSDSITYAPIRNVVGHTGLLTDNAKKQLNLTYENIKARIKKKLSGED